MLHQTLSETIFFKTIGIALCIGLISGCGGKKTPNGTPPDPDPEPPITGDPVNAGPPNATGQIPAFAEQTRAPEVGSNMEFNLDTVTSSLSNPWGMAFLPNGDLLITEKRGRLKQISQDGSVVNPDIGGLPGVVSSGQGGLMDINLAPDFNLSRWVYLSYTESREGNNQTGTTVGRGKLSADNSSLTDFEVIFRQTPSWRSGQHFGSRLVWTPEGQLYITLGERSNNYDSRVLAQDLNGLLGKVVKINADGSIPDDNPFKDGGGMPHIWSYGHRNIQGAVLHPETKALWTIEHGPQGGDELNRPEAGKNYGWPTISYGEDYGGSPMRGDITAQEGMEQPVYYWDPVIAPAGMAFYDGDMFEEWQGNLLIGSLNPGGLVRLVLRGNLIAGEERLLESPQNRVRDVETAEDGSVWLITDDGKLIRLYL